MGLACALLASLPQHYGVAAYVLPTVLLTLGYALFQAANNTAVMAAADANARGLVGGLLSLARNLGLVTGAAGAGAVFVWASGGAATAEAAGAGLRGVFVLGMGLIGVCLGVGWFLGRRW